MTPRPLPDAGTWGRSGGRLRHVAQTSSSAGAGASPATAADAGASAAPEVLRGKELSPGADISVSKSSQIRLLITIADSCPLRSRSLFRPVRHVASRTHQTGGPTNIPGHDACKRRRARLFSASRNERYARRRRNSAPAASVAAPAAAKATITERRWVAGLGQPVLSAPSGPLALVPEPPTVTIGLRGSALRVPVTGLHIARLRIGASRVARLLAVTARLLAGITRLLHEHEVGRSAPLQYHVVPSARSVRNVRVRSEAAASSAHAPSPSAQSGTW